MSLKKRGDVWHYDFTINGRRYRNTTEQTSKSAARKVEDRERERRALGRSHDEIPTLREATRQWFRSRVEGRKSVVTVSHRIKILLALMDGDRLVTEIGTADVEEAIQKRRLQTTRQGKAPANGTVNRDLVDTTLRPILRYCDEILELPMRKIAWQKVKLPEPKERDRPYTEAELAAWRAALAPHHREVWDFIRRYGVRLREAFFAPEAFDPETGRVFLRKRKNGRPHTIRLLEPDRVAMAARYGRALAAGLDTVWFRDDGGKLSPVHWRGFQSASQTAIRKVGLLDARPVHDLRHDAATTLMRQTGNLAAVKRLLGHENIASTMRYAHADDDDVFKALGHAYGTNEPEETNSSTETKTDTGT